MAMASTSKEESRSPVVTRPSSAGELNRRPISVSTRNVGVAVSNQWAANSRVSNSSRTSNGLYTDSVPRQL